MPAHFRFARTSDESAKIFVVEGSYIVTGNFKHHIAPPHPRPTPSTTGAI